MSQQKGLEINFNPFQPKLISAQELLFDFLLHFEEMIYAYIYVYPEHDTQLSSPGDESKNSKLEKILWDCLMFANPSWPLLAIWSDAQTAENSLELDYPPPSCPENFEFCKLSFTFLLLRNIGRIVKCFKLSFLLLGNVVPVDKCFISTN